MDSLCHTERSVASQSEFGFVPTSNLPIENAPQRASSSPTCANPLLHQSSRTGYYTGPRSMTNMKEHHQSRKYEHHQPTREKQPLIKASRRELQTNDIESFDDNKTTLFSSRPKLKIASIYEEWQLALPVKRGRATSMTLPYTVQSEFSPSESSLLFSHLLQQFKTIFGLCRRSQYRSIDYIFEDSFARKPEPSSIFQGLAIALGALSVVVLALIARLYLAPINLDLEKALSWLL